MGDFIVLAVLVLIIALIIFSIWRNHKKGKTCSGCSCNCGNCSSECSANMK